MPISTIRFWSDEFEIINPKRNRKGNRLFTQSDFKNLKLIYSYLKVKHLTIEGAKERLKHNPELQFKKTEIIENLKEIKSFLNELKQKIEPKFAEHSAIKK